MVTKNIVISNQRLKVAGNCRIYYRLMCSLSVYTWTNYSLFEPNEKQFWSVPYQNCLLFMIYLAWDTWSMYFDKSLFRVDLQIHHIIGSVVFGSMIMYIPIAGSMALINECISLLNNVLRDKPYLLNWYRLFCI